MQTQQFKLVLVFLAAAIAAAVFLYHGLEAEKLEFRAALNHNMRESVKDLRGELEEDLSRLQQLARLLTQEQSNLIQQLYSNPGNRYLENELSKKAGIYFPDLLGNLLADASGRPVQPEKVRMVGEQCLSELAEYAQTAFSLPHAHVPNIHLNPVEGSGRHFDVMVPWVNRDSGIYLLSIRDTLLQRLIKRNEGAGYHLLLVDVSGKSSVQLGSTSGAPAEIKKARLSSEELESADHRGFVSGTRWEVIALPDPAYINEKFSEMERETLYIWLLIVFFLLLIVSLWWFEISRGRRLLELNAALQQEVQTHGETEAELRKLTNFDPLTTLPNRKSIDNYFKRLLATVEEEGHRPAVLFFDLDRFQDINDTLGHGYGDVLLKEVASRIKELVEPHDLLARWGGDEFVIVMHNVRDESELAHFANELLEIMRTPIQLHRQAVTTTVSIGVSIYPEAGHTAELLLKNADLAMYRAKNDGRNRFRFFLQEMDDIANERIRLEIEVRNAIESDEFEPYFQPRMDVKTGVIKGCEALMRWQRADELLTPGVFLPVLEETGMIEAAGKAVRDKICRHAREWGRQYLGIGQISINLSGKEFFRQNIVEQLSTAISDCGLESCNFEIEITEGHLMENTADSLSKLHALKNIGFSIAVDDFGTGYSSLSYLRRFPVDVVKIDQSFVRGCVSSPEDQEIIRAIISLAHTLDLHVVAEGVESIAQMELLRAMGCDELQGYFIGHPMSADDYTRFVMNKKKAG